MATVHALFVKPAEETPVVPAQTLEFERGVGIAGDVAADPRSVRQVLLMSREAIEDLGTGPGALRENVCVDGLDVDALPSGTALRVGSARLRIVLPCEPCGKVRTCAGIAPAYAVGRRGVLAVVMGSGSAAVGDAVVDEGQVYAPMPSTWRERVRWYLERLPEGQVMTYGDLSHAVGKPSVARVLPKVLASPAYAGLPVDDIVGSGSPRLREPDARWESWRGLYEDEPAAVTP